MTENFSRRFLIALVVVGVALLVGAGVLYSVWRSSDVDGVPFGEQATPTPFPEIQVTALPSLDEVIALYPNLEQVLSDPDLGAVYKDFLIAYEEGGQEAALELARIQGLLTPDGRGLRVTLVLDTVETGALIEQLEATGVTVVSAYEEQINISVPLALVLQELESDQPGAIFTQLTELDHVIAVQLPETRMPQQRQGGILGEGVAVINADGWHQAGITGAGLRIGVLDLGFHGHTPLLGTDLPASVEMATFGWYEDTENHGTACAEIVHEVAPDATLFFAWYDGSDAAFGEAVEWLLSHNVDIITHSAGGVVSPRDGSGWDAQLVNSVAEQGVLWVNSAGNEAESHYRTTFTDQNGNGWHEFENGREQLPIFANRQLIIYVIWDDHWTRPRQDYNIAVVDEAGEVLVSSTDLQSGRPGQRPAEIVRLEVPSKTVYLMISMENADLPVTFDIFVRGWGAGFDNPVAEYSVTAPGDAVGALTVGAANWDNDSLAGYSSQGPTNDGRLKPEISAPTGVSGVTYGRGGFDGTSASAPHVAGAAALVWQAFPELSRQEVIDYLLEHAVDRGPGGPDTGFGYGRLQLPATPDQASVSPNPRGRNPEPLLTPTPVAFSTPPAAGDGASLAVTALVVTAGGTGCCGSLLLGLVLVLLVMQLSQKRRAPASAPARRSAPQPPAAPPRPAPPPQHAGPPICPRCGAALRSDARFCHNCGQATKSAAAPVCRHCGAALRPGARVCSRCGKPL